jgi:hypothetical protein
MASVPPRLFPDFYRAVLAKGMKPTLARLTLARKMAAITLTLWKKELLSQASMPIYPQWLSGRTAPRGESEVSRRKCGQRIIGGGIENAACGMFEPSKVC